MVRWDTGSQPKALNTCFDHLFKLLKIWSRLIIFTYSTHQWGWFMVLLAFMFFTALLACDCSQSFRSPWVRTTGQISNRSSCSNSTCNSLLNFATTLNFHKTQTKRKSNKWKRERKKNNQKNMECHVLSILYVSNCQKKKGAHPLWNNLQLVGGQTSPTLHLNYLGCSLTSLSQLDFKTLR